MGRDTFHQPRFLKPQSDWPWTLPEQSQAHFVGFTTCKLMSAFQIKYNSLLAEKTLEMTGIHPFMPAAWTPTPPCTLFHRQYLQDFYKVTALFRHTDLHPQMFNVGSRRKKLEIVSKYTAGKLNRNSSNYGVLANTFFAPNSRFFFLFFLFLSGSCAEANVWKLPQRGPRGFRSRQRSAGSRRRQAGRSTAWGGSRAAPASWFWLRDGNSLAMVLASPRGAMGDGSACWHCVRSTTISSCPRWRPALVQPVQGFMASLGYQNPFHAGQRILKSAVLWIQRQIQAWQKRVAFTYLRAESASRCFSGWLLPLSSVLKYCCPRQIEVLLKHIHPALWDQ